MATKTLYVSEEDATLWEQAAAVASKEHRSVAWVVHQALRAYLREALGTAFDATP